MIRHPGDYYIAICDGKVPVRCIKGHPPKGFKVIDPQQKEAIEYYDPSGKLLPKYWLAPRYRDIVKAAREQADKIAAAVPIESVPDPNLSIHPPLFTQLKLTAGHLEFLNQPFCVDLSETGEILAHFNLRTPLELKAALEAGLELRPLKREEKDG